MNSMEVEISSDGADTENIYSYYSSITKPGALSGLSKLNKHFNQSKKVIQESLLSRPTYTLHTPIRKRFTRRRVITNGPGFQLQMDLLDLSHLKTYNKGFKFVLTAIDVFSKVAHAIPLKSKSGDDVLEAIKTVLQSYPKLQYLQTDRGTEFLNKKVKTYLKTKKITHFYTYNDEIKAGIVERFNRTLKMKLWRYFTLSSNYKYINVLDQIVSSYNNTFHRTIGMPPNHVNSKNMELIWWRMYNKIPHSSGDELKVGDYVRIIMNIKRFEKEAVSSWSKEIFKVSEVTRTAPRTYKIVDLNDDEVEGTFYREELQRVHLPITGKYNIEKIVSTRGKGKRKELFVKWEGYPPSFNSWISASSVSRNK